MLISAKANCFENGDNPHKFLATTRLGFGSTEFIVIRPTLEKVFPRFLFYLL